MKPLALVARGKGPVFALCRRMGMMASAMGAVAAAALAVVPAPPAPAAAAATPAGVAGPGRRSVYPARGCRVKVANTGRWSEQNTLGAEP
jgi:hypothetical protein